MFLRRRPRQFHGAWGGWLCWTPHCSTMHGGGGGAGRGRWGVHMDTASLNYDMWFSVDVLTVTWSLRASLWCGALFHAWKDVREVGEESFSPPIPKGYITNIMSGRNKLFRNRNKALSEEDSIYRQCKEKQRRSSSTFRCVAVVTLAQMSVVLLHCDSLVPAGTERLCSLYICSTFKVATCGEIAVLFVSDSHFSLKYLLLLHI